MLAPAPQNDPRKRHQQLVKAFCTPSIFRSQIPTRKAPASPVCRNPTALRVGGHRGGGGEALKIGATLFRLFGFSELVAAFFESALQVRVLPDFRCFLNHLVP